MYNEIKEAWLKKVFSWLWYTCAAVIFIILLSAFFGAIQWWNFFTYSLVMLVGAVYLRFSIAKDMKEKSAEDSDGEDDEENENTSSMFINIMTTGLVIGITLIAISIIHILSTASQFLTFLNNVPTIIWVVLGILIVGWIVLKLWPKKKQTDGTTQNPTPPVVIRSRPPWYFGFATIAWGLLLLSVAAWIGLAVWHRINTEKNHGLGSTVSKSPEMIAETYSRPLYTTYPVLDEGRTYHVLANKPYRYQGTHFGWHLTPGQENVDRWYDTTKDGKWGIITFSRDCEIKIADDTD